MTSSPPMDLIDDEIASNDVQTLTCGNNNDTNLKSGKRTSKASIYYTRNISGDYCCNICKKSTPSKEVILKRDKTGSTIKLWRHLKKCHIIVYRQIKSSNSQPSVINFFGSTSTQSKFLGRNPDQTIEECLDLIIHTDTPFSILDEPQFEKFVSYFAQCNITLPCAMTVRQASLERFEDGKTNLRELLQLVEKVSLTMDTWTTNNGATMFGITVHWIDDTWTIRERVLSVELIDSHTNMYLTNVFIRVLKDYNLTHKVCAITTDNASDNNTMVAALERVLNDTGSRFNQQYNVPCIAHILNLAVQQGLKELSNQITPSDDEESEECVDASQHNNRRTFGDILYRLRQLIIAARASPQRINHYKDLCEQLGMSNNNMIVEDVPTKWNSTYNMLEIAWEKREVLDKMASDYLNTTKMNYSIASEEWELLKMFTDELLSFHEIIEVLSKSKTITASIVLRVYQLLLDQLDSSIDTLNNLSNSAGGSTMNIEQLMTLKSIYKVMKEKLIKYECHLKRKSIFSIAMVLDPQMKINYIHVDEQAFVLQSLIQLLEAVPNPSSLSQGRQYGIASVTEGMSSANAKRSKVMIALMKRQRTSLLRVEQSTRTEMDDYLSDPCIDGYNVDSLEWWCKIGCHKYPRLAVLAKEFLSICATSVPSKRLFSVGQEIVSFKQRSLTPETISILMTLKCWAREDDTDFENITSEKATTCSFVKS